MPDSPLRGLTERRSCESVRSSISESRRLKSELLTQFKNFKKEAERYIGHIPLESEPSPIRKSLAKLSDLSRYSPTKSDSSMHSSIVRTQLKELQANFQKMQSRLKQNEEHLNAKDSENSELKAMVRRLEMSVIELGGSVSLGSTINLEGQTQVGCCTRGCEIQ